MFINDDAFGIAAVSYASKVLIRRVVSKNVIRAVLFQSFLALVAGAI